MSFKILIADDSIIARNSLKNTILSSLPNSEIIMAVNGIEAESKIISEKPDLLLLDLLMPEKDGFGVLSELKSNKVNIPVLVLSADIQETTKAKCLELGAKFFINKPPNNQELIDAIKSII